MSKLHILIVDDEKPARYGMNRALAKPEYDIQEAADGQSALAVIRSGFPDLVFLDLNMPGMDGLGVLRELGGDRGRCEIIVVTANDRVATAVECMRLGAADYINKPYEIEQLRAIARRAAERKSLEERVDSLQAELDEKRAFGALVGASRPMRELYNRMTRAARAPLDILIRGETGTGKELIAREIHRLSDRSSGPFVAVNTAAISESLMESELFGHVKGAFTGAQADRRGVFEQADGGTLFLDEIGDMPAPAQAKILRALQERTIQPVGSNREVRVNVRVVTATHQNLEEAISSGGFRQDLLFRIRGVELQVPPLRQRREDFFLLANYFLERLAQKMSLPVRQLGADAVDRLLGYHWPGNVRELEQTLTAAAALCESETIGADDLSLSAAPPAKDHPAGDSFAHLTGLPLTEAKDKLVADFERTAIAAALRTNDGNVSAAARQLGIHRQSLQQKMDQLGIRRHESP